MPLPDLSEYVLQRSTENATFEGTAVPGLRADFYHRTDGERVASVGRYSYAGADLLMAWGYTDEEHCRHNAVVDSRGGWHPAGDGCPAVELVRAAGPGAPVIGLRVRAPGGTWVTAGASAPA
ncbi:hypothetical protein [Actinoplanes siamensis]|uniref:Uncharacterized protein n=1 Tax=Actinoplanes siamensis TaxID=1223317 RepID=A0A919KCB1_9ACTN|nr:hypothetical protein [Actinoplanes siamensis]GIF02799.1 hypothetical protein Asi03nite_03370 [Actinoplanes siamensis]